MRIAIVAQEYPPETAKGGIGTQAYAKAHGLTRLGHEIIVISRCVNGVRSDRRDDDVRVIRVRPALDAYTEIADWLSYSDAVAAEIAQVHERSPLDLVEFPEWACEAYVHLLNRTDANRVPTVIQLHGPVAMLSAELGWPEPGSDFHRLAMQFERTCLTKANALYSSSACSADWCAREYGLDRAKIPVLHTGVDTKHFSPRKVERDARPTIVFAGKITWNKGVVTLVDAAIKLVPRFGDLRVRLLGRAEEQVAAELKRRVTAAGCEKLLEFGGFVDHDTLPTELSKADVFAAPSRYEGGPGFVYLEAMACGLPAVACAGSGAAEVIVPQVNGDLVPPDDPHALAEALSKLLLDRSIKSRAREYVVEHFDTANCVGRIESFFKQVVSEQSR